MKCKLTELILLVSLIGTLVVLSKIETASASGTIYIRPDGSVDPPTAPIHRTGDIYSFSGDISETIIVEKNNIVIDGNGYLLQGSGTGSGFNLTNRNNVTIKNSQTAHFDYGILLFESEGNTLTQNILTANTWAGILISNSSDNLIIKNEAINNIHDGIDLWGINTQSNTVTGNNVSANGGTEGGDGISIGLQSSYNTIVDNIVSGNSGAGISLGWEWSTGNVITGNSITSNVWTGIYMAWETESGNIFYHNNMDNNLQVFTVQALNTWDNGYPSCGNYWSDYTGSDLNGDGIGDTPYVIDADNQDNYPFMNPWTPQAYDVAIEEVEPSKICVGQGYDVRINVTVTNQGSYTQTFNIIAYANQTKIETKTIALAGHSSETITFAWNATGVTKGFYTLNATADQMPGEIDTLDNTHKNGTIKITIAGDVDGDTIVNVNDLFLIGKGYGSTLSNTNWNSNCDINEDGTVSKTDLEIAAENYSKTA